MTVLLAASFKAADTGSATRKDAAFRAVRSSTAHRGAPSTTRASPQEAKNAQQSALLSSSAWCSEALRDLWRKVWSHPVLLLANCPLFEEMR